MEITEQELVAMLEKQNEIILAQREEIDQLREILTDLLEPTSRERASRKPSAVLNIKNPFENSKIKRRN
jgi:hypothetical protein